MNVWVSVSTSIMSVQHAQCSYSRFAGLVKYMKKHDLNWNYLDTPA